MWHVACMEGSDVDAVPADHETWGPGDLERVEYCNLFGFFFRTGFWIPVMGFHGIWE